ncbi:hypothetical protein KCU91_g2083, partial [Aureobasidium melanogenum]
MDPNPQTKTSAANAITTLRSTFHTSTQALKTLVTYIRHLEELVLEELGREEFERRLGKLILRDQCDEESLFIPEDTLISRKRRGSSSTEMGSEMRKKVRADSAVSDLGRSIFDGGGRGCSEETDVSPKSARKTPVPWDLPAVEPQQTTATKNVKQTARRPIIAPRSRPPRGSHSALLPNKQPSSNFHSGIQSTLLPNLHPSSDHHSGSSSPSARRSSMSTVHSSTKQSSPASSRRDSVQSEKAASKQPHSDSLISSIRNTPLPGPNSSNSAKPFTAHAFPEKPVVPSAPASSSSIKQPPSLKSKSSSSSSSDRTAPSSRQGLSLGNKSMSGSSRPALSSEQQQQQQQPLSLTRRASKK